MVLQHQGENDYLCKYKLNQMKLEEKELKSLRDLNSEFQSLKVQLGELAIQKNSVLKRVDSIRFEFESLENELIKKYGENSVINLEHGTVTQKKMAKISNTTSYPTKGSPAGTDYVIGTDASSKETKTFTLQSIADLYAGSGSGTVTSVGLNAGTTGLIITSDTANPITTTGTFTLGGVLATANGGTGLSALGTRSQSLRINAAADGLEYVDSNVVEVIRNNTSNPILKGQPLKVVGEVAGVVSVEVAQADSSSNMPCIGLAAEDIAATSNGLMIQVGMLKEVNINTIQGAGSAAVGDIVYVSATAVPGTLLLTRDKPSSTALIQNIGIISKTGANGDIQVTAIGRTNDLPNLPQGNIWLGDSNGVPAATINSLDNLSNVSYAGTNDSSMYIGNGVPTGLVGTPTKTTTLGEGAGNGTTSGSSNTLIGTNAGIGVTTGSTNTLIGAILEIL